MSQSGPQAHPWIMNLNPYVPGKASLDNGRPVVKLSANESVFGPSPAALEAARTAADDICRYPDGGSHALRHAIADVHSLDADRIVCGAGSDDLLTLLIHAYAGPGKEVIYSQYGFMVYPLVTESVGATGIAVPNKNWAADVDGILDAVTDNTTLVFIDNPNNPTGAYLNWDEIKRLHSSLPAHVLLVLDAAYAECVTAEDYKAGEELVDAFDNVVMTRTFSKMYALAGLRVGWAYAPAAVVDILNRIRMPFNVCLPGQYAAIAAMQDQVHLKASVEFNREWRNWVRARLMALGLDVVESETNFLLIEFPDESPFTAKEANAYLMDNGYILRHLGFLPNHLRLSIGTEEQNRAVVELLTAFMNGAGHSDPALS